MTTTGIKAGLEGVVAAETHLSSVDGLAGELIIAGFPLEELAGHATFEETIYLLWHDELPDAETLAAFRAELAAHRAVPAATLALLQAAAAAQVPVMDALRMGASSLSLAAPDDNPSGEPRRDALLLVATFRCWSLITGACGKANRRLNPGPTWATQPTTFIC
jgi:citrate synthase